MLRRKIRPPARSPARSPVRAITIIYVCMYVCSAASSRPAIVCVGQWGGARRGELMPTDRAVTACTQGSSRTRPSRRPTRPKDFRRCWRATSPSPSLRPLGALLPACVPACLPACYHAPPCYPYLAPPLRLFSSSSFWMEMPPRLLGATACSLGAAQV